MSIRSIMRRWTASVVVATLLASSSFGPTWAGAATAPGPSCIGGGDVAIDPADHPPGVPLHLGTQSYARTLDLCDHTVVLTFDDGPAAATTPLVLRALKEAGVHATFFLVGRQTRAFPDLARQELREGHSIGHHSDTHPSFTLRGFDTASAETDIENGIRADDLALYGRAQEAPVTPFFRFPGFADTPALLDDLDARGIAVFGSDVWAGDWIAMTPERERERVMAELEKRPRHNGIILFHDTRRSTARMLPALLTQLKAEGFHVAHLVYAKGATAPPLTAPIEATPVTQTIIAHLPTPIVPGAHHLGEAVAQHRRRPRTMVAGVHRAPLRALRRTRMAGRVRLLR